MASLSNINNTFSYSLDSNKKNGIFEDEKSDIYLSKSIHLRNPNNYMISNEKLSNFFKPTIFDELSFYETESLLIENQLKSIEISKQLKALKIQDLRSIIERISEEDYFDRFIDNRCLFTFEKKCNSSSLQDKTLCGMLTSNEKSPKESNSDDKGSENNEVSSKSDHLNSCILYWTQVINPQFPKSNNFRV